MLSLHQKTVSNKPNQTTLRADLTQKRSLKYVIWRNDLNIKFKEWYNGFNKHTWLTNQ